jgi:hypothetical protein
MTRYQIMGHKGPVLRPKCNGTARTPTHVIRRRQNRTCYRSRNKEVALKPVEGYTRFRPPLAFMFTSPPI